MHFPLWPCQSHFLKLCIEMNRFAGYKLVASRASMLGIYGPKRKTIIRRGLSYGRDPELESQQETHSKEMR